MLIVISSLLALVLTVYLLLWIPPVQQKIKDIALKELMKKTNNQLSVGHFYLRPFNHLELKDIYVSDLKGDTMLYAQHLSAGFSPLQLLNSRLLINSIQLENFDIYVSKDSVPSDFNFQFLIDAFTPATKDTTSSSLVVEINDIVLKNGYARYDIWSMPITSALKVDYNHMEVKNLNAEINLRSIDILQLDAAIKSLSLDERSGFSLKNLAAGLSSEGKKLKLKDLYIELPHSELAIPHALVDYEGMNLGEMLQGAKYELNLDIQTLLPADAGAFYQPLRQLPETATLQATASGTFPEINIHTFRFNYSNSVAIDLEGLMEDCFRWDSTGYHVDIRKILVTSQGVRDVNRLLLGIPTSALPFRPLDITLSGKINGSLPAFDVDLLAQNRGGSAHVTANGGYLLKQKNLQFDVNLIANSFNIQPFVPRVQLGVADLTLSAKGSINGSTINADAHADINRFDYNGYAYNRIQADVFYHGDSLHADVNSKDPNMALTLEAEANFNKNKNAASLSATLNQVNLSVLGFVSASSVNTALSGELPKQLKVSGIIHAQVTGFDIEKMNAGLNLDSLVVETAKGTFYQEQIQFSYLSTDNMQKKIRLQSEMLQASIDGNFKPVDAYTAFTNTLSGYLPGFFQYKKIKRQESFNLNGHIIIDDTRDFTQTLNLPFSVPQQATIDLRYNESSRFAEVDLNIPQVDWQGNSFRNTSLQLNTDTIQSILKLDFQTDFIQSGADSIFASFNATAGKGQLDWTFHADDKSKGNLNGDLTASMTFEKKPMQKLDDIFMKILPTSWQFNQQEFKIEPSELAMINGTYQVKQFKIAHADDEYIQIDGIASSRAQDSLKLNIAHIQLETIMEVLRNTIGLKGEANGEIVVTQALASPLIMTNGFTIKDISLKDSLIGTLDMTSGWSNERQGLMLKIDLKQANEVESVISGFVLPKKDSLQLNAHIKDIQLAWLSPFTQSFLYDLKGAVNADVRVGGKLSKPQISGVLALQNAGIGVNMTATKYTISDSIQIRPDLININNFRIVDENGKTAIINGTVKYQDFKTYQPDISMKLNDFMLLNNTQQTDSLFFGHLLLNGNIQLTGNEKQLLAKMTLRNSGKGKVFVLLPQGAASQAQQYTSITYISPKDTLLEERVINIPQLPVSSLPLKLQITLALDKDLTLGAIINPSTKDQAFVSGAGSVDFNYNMSTQEMGLYGDYTIDDGQYTFSLKNITSKDFKIKSGGTVAFKGDPMATAFDVTAIYSLKADLATLDPSFTTSSYLPTTKVPVNCLINISGDINKIEVSYDVQLPNSDEEVQRKVNGLLYSDDIKIKEIAYLLSIGSFWPPQSDGSSGGSQTTWVSLASAPLSSLINSMFSSVLSENWTIGTELHATDEDLSDLEMDLNVSTRLFKDKVTVNSNIGYKNSSNTDNNFTGDFDVQVKLNKSGSLKLKAYTVTNDEFYEQAPTTQGVGVLYQKSGKTFRQLFKKKE